MVTERTELKRDEMLVAFCLSKGSHLPTLVSPEQLSGEEATFCLRAIDWPIVPAVILKDSPKAGEVSRLDITVAAVKGEIVHPGCFSDILQRRGISCLFPSDGRQKPEMFGAIINYQFRGKVAKRERYIHLVFDSLDFSGLAAITFFPHRVWNYLGEHKRIVLGRPNLGNQPEELIYSMVSMPNDMDLSCGVVKRISEGQAKSSWRESSIPLFLIVRK